MTTIVSIYDIAPFLIEQIEMDKEVILVVSGNSMFPFYLDRKTKVILKKPKEKLKKKQVVFYRNAQGQYLLHRILKVRKSGYVICGDGLTQKEYISKDAMIAVCISHYKFEKQIAESNLKYRFKVSLWLILKPIRPILLRLMKRGKKHVRN